MFRVMTLDFRGRIHLLSTAESRSQVPQTHFTHIFTFSLSLPSGDREGKDVAPGCIHLKTDCRRSLSNYLWSPKFCPAIVIKDESESMLSLHFFKESLWICLMTSSLLNTDSLLPTRILCDICLLAILPESFRVDCKITWPVVSWIQGK